MAQDVIYPGEGSVSTWEKGEIHWGEMSYRYQLREKNFKKFQHMEAEQHPAE